MNKEEVIEQLRNAAKRYEAADKALGHVCGEAGIDPIACTVYALKQRNDVALFEESLIAAKWLTESVRLHGLLVQNYNMDSDDVRKIWFPILNK